MAALTLLALAAFVASASAECSVLFGGASSISQYGPTLLAGGHATGQTYASVGSGAGQQNFIAGTYCIAASDDPMSAATDRAAALAGGKFTTPLCLGTYSLIVSGANGVQLSAANIAAIYQGTVTTWSDKSLVAAAGMSGTIHPIFRSDASGTTELLTLYLKAALGAKWPTSLTGLGPFAFAGTGKSGSGGVAGAVAADKGAIGYVQTGIGIQEYPNYEVAIQSLSKQYLLASRADPVQAIPRPLVGPSVSWAGVSLVYVKGTGTYPIESFVYMFVHKTYSKAQGPKIIAFLKYLMGTNAQTAAKSYYFNPLPNSVVKQNLAAYSQIKLV